MDELLFVEKLNVVAMPSDLRVSGSLCRARRCGCIVGTESRDKALAGAFQARLAFGTRLRESTRVAGVAYVAARGANALRWRERECTFNRR